MEFPPVSLTQTKLRPPALRPRMVARSRLVERLQREAAGVVLVCAPAGYGKTTLMAEWARALRQSGTAVAWYSLDESDDASLPFGAYLCASLEHALNPGSGLGRVSQMLRSAPEADLQKVLPAIINAVDASRQPCVLVLDDFHLARSPAIHKAVSYLVDHLPDNLRVAIGSRTSPPLPLARLRARGQLFDVRAADLRFNAEETARFLGETMGLPLSGEASSRLAAQTEGWAAGLQLAALSLAGHSEPERMLSSFSGGHRRLAEYLLEEVANQQPEDVQSFLLYTSILERLSAPLCDAVLQSGGSASILERLERSNLFLVALDERGEWFRYHHLFRDFLLAWLEQTQPEKIAALHRSACEWLAARGLLREAARHAFQTGDWDFAAGFVEQHCFTLIIQSEIATIYEWTSAFPEAVMESRPMLCLMQALAMAYHFQKRSRDRVEARLDQAGRVIALLPDREAARSLNEMAGVVRTFLAMAPDPDSDPRAQMEISRSILADYPAGHLGRFTGLLIAGYAHLAMNQPQAAQSALEEAQPLALRGGLLFGAVESTFHLARLAFWQGDPTRSVELCNQLQVELSKFLAGQSFNLPALGCLDVALGCVLLEQGRLAEAEDLLHSGLARMGWGMNPYYLMTGYLALFRLYEIEGREADAAGCLDRLDEIWPDIQFCTRGLRIQAALRFDPENRSALERAVEWAQTYTRSSGSALSISGMGPLGAAEVYFQANLVWAQLQIALGRAEEALSFLNAQIETARANGLVGKLLILKVLEAQACQSLGQQEQALAALEGALQLARPEGFASAFDQGPALDELVRAAAERGMGEGFAGQVLSAVRAARGKAVQLESGPILLGELVEPLSERELEVLVMMADGATNKAIAERFVITVGTVKSHINHILGKLGASNRTEAVMRARKLGLLRES